MEMKHPPRRDGIKFPICPSVSLSTLPLHRPLRVLRALHPSGSWMAAATVAIVPIASHLHRGARVPHDLNERLITSWPRHALALLSTGHVLPLLNTRTGPGLHRFQRSRAPGLWDVQ